MRRLALTAALFAAVLVLPSTAQAQFAGKWSFELGEWQTDGGANLQIRGGNDGTLQLTVKGDSAIGQWTTASSQTPMEIRGKIEGNKLVAKGSREGRVNRNGEESAVTVTLTFELTAANGELSGTLRMANSAGPSAHRTAKGKAAT